MSDDEIIVRANDIDPILKLKIKDLYAQMESLGMIK